MYIFTIELTASSGVDVSALVSNDLKPVASGLKAVQKDEDQVAMAELALPEAELLAEADGELEVVAADGALACDDEVVPPDPHPATSRLMVMAMAREVARRTGKDLPKMSCRSRGPGRAKCSPENDSDDRRNGQDNPKEDSALTAREQCGLRAGHQSKTGTAVAW